MFQTTTIPSEVKLPHLSVLLLSLTVFLGFTKQKVNKEFLLQQRKRITESTVLTMKEQFSRFHPSPTLTCKSGKKVPWHYPNTNREHAELFLPINPFHVPEKGLKCLLPREQSDFFL